MRSVFLSACVFIVLTACQPAVVEYAIPDPIFRQVMDGELAIRIAKGCSNLDTNMTHESVQETAMAQLQTLGFNGAEAMGRLEQAREERGAQYLKAYVSVIPVGPQDFCAIGNHEIEAKTRVGKSLNRT